MARQRELTYQVLHEAALAYVAQRETTGAHLSLVLWRRVRRAPEPPAEAGSWIDDILERFQQTQLVDDRRYARLRAQSLLRGGASRRAVVAKLMQKGVARDAIDSVLAELTEAEPDAEWNALERYAQRRRVGPYRTGEADRTQRLKERQRLLRAGFSSALVSRLLG